MKAALNRLLQPRGSVRRSILLLIGLALVPLMILGVARSLVVLDRDRAAVEAQLSERALSTARAESEVLTTARALLTLLSDSTDVQAGGPACSMALAQASSGFSAFSNVSRFDANGALLCSSTQPTPLASVVGQPWWPVADTAGKFFVSGPHWGTMSQRKVLVAVLPVHAPGDAKGSSRFQGVLTASIDLGWMQRSLRSRTLQSDAVSLVLDGEGKPLLSSEPVSFSALDIRLQSGAILEVRDAEGHRWSYAVAPLVTSFDGRNALHIAYAMPHAILFSWSWWQAGLIATTPFFAVLLASIAIWFGSSQLILRWLTSLRLLAERFAAGDYHARDASFCHAPQEFQALANGLYRMSEAVQARDIDLRAALEQQQALVREIHHRVKNNLQVITSLLNLPSTDLDGEAATAFIEKTRLRIATIALVHRLLYEAGELELLSSRTLFGDLCGLLRRTYRDRPEIELNCDFAESPLQLDTAVSISLWLVEAVSNAMLHAFPKPARGRIETRFTICHGQGLLTVAEDGIGFAVAGGAQSGRGQIGRGLRMLAGIGKQMGGQTTIQSAPETGTMLSLAFPLPIGSD